MTLSRKLLFSLIPLLALLVCAEVACRVKYFVQHEQGLPFLLAPLMWNNKEEVINIPQVIRVNAPVDAMVYSPCRNDSLLRSYHEINGFKWRGRAFEPVKPSGVYRILAVGGSTVESRNNGDEETWAVQLETMLNDSSAAGTRCEVINGGKVGYNSESVYLHLLENGFALKPDMVVYHEAYNDVNKGLIDKKIGLLGRSAFGWLHRRLYFSSMLYTYLVQKWHYRQAERLFMAAADPASAETRLIVEGMQKIIRACRERSIRFVYVRQAVDFPIAADGIDLTVRQPLEALLSGRAQPGPALRKLLGTDDFPLKQRLVNAIQTETCLGEGVMVIDPLPALDEARSGGQNLFTDMVHKTCSGERIMARVICDSLRTVLENVRLDGEVLQ